MFHSMEILRISNPIGSISRNPERTVLRRGSGDSEYIRVLQQKSGSQNIKMSLLIKENQISQVGDFLCYHILSFLRAHHGEWLQSNGW